MAKYTNKQTLGETCVEQSFEADSVGEVVELIFEIESLNEPPLEEDLEPALQ